jgi:uncharacterized protein (TIGR03435 family)
MYVTRNQFIGTGAFVLLIVAAFAVKAIWYPAVDEKFFLLDYQRLERAPAHVLILRPTHFAASRRTGGFAAPTRLKNGKYDGNRMRAVGRNAPLADVIATAYQCPGSRIILPPLATTNRFDFLVTATRHPMDQFRAAIKSKLGYTASWQPREVEVLVLKVQGSGPAPSAGDRENYNFKAGKLYIQHAPLQQLAGMAENWLNQPVLDQTGLTGFYDFTIPWQGRNNLDEQSFKNSLAGMGLTLESDTQSMPMMVVEDVK